MVVQYNKEFALLRGANPLTQETVSAGINL